MAVRFGAVVKQQLRDTFVATIRNRTAGGVPGEQTLLDLDALRLGLVFGEANPGHFGVGVGHGWNDAGVKRGGSQLLIALQFTCDDFCRYVRLMHRLVRQHGLAHNVADGEDVGHVGAHLDVDVDEAAVRHRHAGLVGGDLFAVGRAAYGLQHQVVVLRRGGRNACVASSLALFCRCKRHFNAFGQPSPRYGLEYQCASNKNNPLDYNWSMLTIAELPEYIRRAEKLMSSAERLDIVNYLASHPKAGDLLEGTGGVRKLRWGRGAKGKSGGVRVIYYVHSDAMPLYLLTLFAKNEKANINKAERNELAELVELLVQIWLKS